MHGTSKVLNIPNDPHLPHGFDAFLEEVYVAVGGELTRPRKVAVVSPELLHLQEKKTSRGRRGKGGGGRGEGGGRVKQEKRNTQTKILCHLQLRKSPRI